MEEMESLRKLHVDMKLEKSRELIRETLERYGSEKTVLAVTGGKDSTTCLWLLRQVCMKAGFNMPRCIFIDEGDVFQEIRVFMEGLSQKWSLDICELKNDDVLSKVENIGDMVSVGTLDAANRFALEEMGFVEKEFPFFPDSVVCNHLMKTIPLRKFIADSDIDALITAIRGDEQDARAHETFFSSRTNPDHTRVHPLLHVTERDIWIAIFKHSIPYNSLYVLGYRSLGAKCATSKVSDIPAWMQDLENTPERSGRGREKEKIMDQLRQLGYM